MKSKISCCNGPVFRKNLTRFAPAWVLYTICLLLGLFLMTDSGMEYWFCANIANSTAFMAIVNFAYAALTALLLFGDLTNTRLCNALHALPLRRESWFLTNVLSGIFFSVLPTVIAAAAAVAGAGASSVENGWQIPLYWLLSINLEYLFFFGLAVFCMFLTGSRIGAAVVYCLLNFLAVLAFYVAEIIYVPHLPGVVAQIEPFLLLCPVAQVCTLKLISTQQVQEFSRYNVDGSEIYLLRGTFSLGEGWDYLWICAGVGAVLLLLSLLMYRRRKLECAGDLMAAKPLEAPFLVLYSIVAGSLLQLVYVAFNGYDAYGTTVLLWIGLAVGWFTGRMLLRRSTRVISFRSFRSFLGLAVLMAAMGASLVVNSMDPFGIIQWTPEAGEVKSVTLNLSYMSRITLEDPEDIEDVIYLHTIAADELLEGELGAVNTPVELEEGDGTYIELTYKMKDGTTHAREYFILIDSEAGHIARGFFSRIDAIFSDYYDVHYLQETLDSPEALLSVADEIADIHMYGVELPAEQLTPENVEALLHAIIADSEAGTLVQHRAFHPEPAVKDENGDPLYWSYDLYLYIPKWNVYVEVYSDSENTLAWLEENGLLEAFQTNLETFG